MSGNNRPTSAADLRKQAEEKAAQSPQNPAELSPEQIQQTLHELRVHQIELEMQNEELRQSQSDLCASKTRYFDLYDLAPIGYCTLGETGVILEANLTAATMLGAVRGALVNQPLTKFILKEDQDIYYHHRKQLLESEVTKVWELRMVKQDGAVFWAGLNAAAVQDENGATFCRVVLSDITGRKKADEEHLKYEQQLQRMDKLDSLGVLAGGIAHDFNNLLAGIFGYLELAREQCVADKSVSKYLDKALTVFERAKDLTRQLLTFSKGGAPKRKTGQLGALIKENAAFVLSGSNIRCEYRIAQDLRLCDFDENQIGQVIDNIVINAQQAMPLGGTIVITVDNISLKNGENPALKAGNYVKVAIADTGIGIPQNMLKRIFDPFFTTKQKGNGLGLATCYSIIQKHEGCIDVESVFGKGSTFHIFLPASHKGMVVDSTQSASQHKGKGGILIMDDEDFMREITGEMLTTMGYTCFDAKDGKEALRLCAEAMEQGHPIIGALFDLTIPGGMGGKEAIVELRKKFPNMAVFASSGFSEDPIMAYPTEFGFTDSIRKPFKKNELAEMLDKHLKTDR
jgi:two-component system cell cycle sensor histidine kinase/response regulator CckA